MSACLRFSLRLMATQAELDALEAAIIEDATVGIRSMTADGVSVTALTPAERLAILEDPAIVPDEVVDTHKSFGMRHRRLDSPGGWGRG